MENFTITPMPTISFFYGIIIQMFFVTTNVILFLRNKMPLVAG